MSICDLRISIPIAMECTGIGTGMDIHTPSPTQLPPMNPRTRKRESNMPKTLRCVAAFAILVLVRIAPGSAQQSPNPVPESAPQLIIGSGDLIEVTVFGEADLSGRFRVNEKGDISVPLIGPVHAAGKTAEETATALNRRYVEAEILNPDHAYVTVFITEY